MVQGYVALILHAHLPFIRHPEHEDSFEEKWLFEAISETYIPLINVYQSLIDDNIDFKITMSLTPTLISMLVDPLLQQRYVNYLIKLIELCEKEIVRTKNQPEFNSLAYMYLNKYKNDYYTFEHKYNRNIVQAFKYFQDIEKLEIITCTATHAYLPFLQVYPEAVKAQIEVGIKTYQEHFGKNPNGIWLPECAYHKEVEKFLLDQNIQYIITESHGILYADPRPIYGTFAPVVSPNGLVAFGRDIESSKQVWSADEGYPGDPDYREFYRDIGYDLDYEYIRPYINRDGKRIHTGIKYYRITGKTNDKKPYNPDWAREKAAIHAGNFMFNREHQIKYLAGWMKIPPIIICPYDAELFGHWWYEGPQWLNFLFRKAQYDQNIFKMITPSEYLNKYPYMQVTSICESSWGYNGYNEVWLNGSNDWIYRHLHKASELMIELANKNPSTSGIKEQALNQAARELMLAQSSDWAFIMKTGTVVEYAKMRTIEHIGRFNKLYHDINQNNIDTEWLKNIQTKNNIFPKLNYRIYKS